jgi:DNA-binding LacI/PurR family transcriptional regulator
VAGDRLLSVSPRPTAVFVASDEMAMGLMHTAGRLGVRVPDELSVVGVDDHEQAWVHGLTTVAQPVQHEGEEASRLLLEALARRGKRGQPAEVRPDVPRDADVEAVTVATQLIVRTSTAPPAAGAAATAGSAPMPAVASARP